MSHSQDKRYIFRMNDDGSIGAGTETTSRFIREMPKYGDILVKIAKQRTGSFMSRHDNHGFSVWEIDLDRGDGSFGFYIWKSDIAHRSNWDEFFTWLLEAYPVDYQFVLFNMEFFENRFILT